MNIYIIIGAIGLVTITLGVINNNRRTENILYIIGGICLAIYSIYLKNTIFTILQIVFTIAAIYNIIKIKSNKKK
jgi:hypothetical protein